MCTGGGQETSSFPRKKSPVSSVLLSLAVSWGIGKKNPPLNPKATFDSDKSLAWSRSAARQNQLKEGEKKMYLLTSMLDFQGKEKLLLRKDKEREVRGLSNRVKNNYLGIISSHRSVCTTAVFTPRQVTRGCVGDCCKLQP